MTKRNASDPEFRAIDKLVRGLPPPPKGNRVYKEPQLREQGLTGPWLRSLAVCVTAAGHRSWRLGYYVKGIERSHTIGATEAWPARDVWTEAARLRRVVDAGGDPQQDRRDEQQAPTVRDLADRYLEHATMRNRPRTVIENRALLDRLILPEIGNLKVVAVEPEHIARLFRKVSGHAPVTANRVHSLVRRMFNLARSPEFRMLQGRPNPAVGAVERNPEERRTRYLEPDELARLLRAVAAHKNRQSADVIRLALLTGARRGELLNATWDQFNGDIWVKPASTTKQKKTHTVVLNGPARQLLAAMREAHDKENIRRSKFDQPPLVHLFPGYGSNGAQGDLKRSWASICKVANITGLRFHDLRHSFASFLVSSGHNLPLIGAMLGHSSPATTSRYAHLLIDPQRQAAERLGEIVAGADTAPMKGAA